MDVLRHARKSSSPPTPEELAMIRKYEANPPKPGERQCSQEEAEAKLEQLLRSRELDR
jgi:hypothetical protein